MKSNDMEVQDETGVFESLEMDEGQPCLPEMISLGNNLKTNKMHSDVDLLRLTSNFYI